MKAASFTAWFGYGFNWDLTVPPYFNTISKVKFKVLGANQGTRVQKFIKTAGAGDANMVMIDEFDVDMVKYYLLTVTAGGAPGTAQAHLQVYDALPDHGDRHHYYLPGSARVCQPGTWPQCLLGKRDPAGWRYLVCHGRGPGCQALQAAGYLNDSVPADPDPWGEAHTFVHGIGDYYTAFQSFEIDFSQFWRLGNIIDCRDRKARKVGKLVEPFHGRWHPV